MNKAEEIARDLTEPQRWALRRASTSWGGGVGVIILAGFDPPLIERKLSECGLYVEHRLTFEGSAVADCLAEG